jgi:hypothetical protein
MYAIYIYGARIRASQPFPEAERIPNVKFGYPGRKGEGGLAAKS